MSAPISFVMVGLGMLLLILAVVAAKTAGRAPARRELQRRSSHAPGNEALDTEDLAELLAATNAWRRTHGLRERTVTDAIREFEG